MLVYVRPSNEALLRARVPGAQDQCGCRSTPFIVRVLPAKGHLAAPFSFFSSRALREHRDHPATPPPFSAFC
jgi:hypothetical protein